MQANLFDKLSGEILQCMISDDVTHITETETVGVIFEEIPYRELYKYYVEDNKIISKPEKPSKNHQWDVITKSWVYSEALYNENILILKESINNTRLNLLQESDWTDTVSAVTRLGETKYNEWQVYRQALRDITLQPGYPTDIVWPNPPQ